MKIRKILLIFLVLGGLIIFYKFSTHPLVLKTFFPEKIWVHRVNSLEKLEEVSNKFTGVEVDVVWLNRSFDVNHPPAKSIGLDLGRYLLTAEEKGVEFIWLDVKSLIPENSIDSFTFLDSLTNLSKRKKQNIIIESPNPEALKPFRSGGYLTSYYLPSGLHEKSREKLALIKDIDENIRENPTDYISSSLGEYIYMKDFFKEKQMLLWHTGNLNSIKNKVRIYRALLDERVEVILLPYTSEVGDR